MKIIADANTPFIKEAFRDIGDVIALDTPWITNQSVRDADILLVRSDTRVGESLLEGSSVRFVGTTTIGTDHIDLDYLRNLNITFANAPGCNSNSVKEYVVAALLSFATRHEISLEGKTFGVVGVGNVGSKVVKAVEALGMTVLQNDPPLARQTGESRFVSLDAILGADFITLHVPLTRDGQDPTYHLFDEPQFRRLKNGAALLNTSRGPVVNTDALKDALKQGHISAAILDVWEKEPAIDRDALSMAAIGTSHIAGYSMDGKLTAVRMVREALCRYLEIPSAWDPGKYLRTPEHPNIEPKSSGLIREAALHSMVRQAYDVEEDDARLRRMLSLEPKVQADYFVRLRTGYHYRREFPGFTVNLSPEYSSLSSTLTALGFTCQPA
jgi:erythronate-4-phosphate dehydrogenase